MSLINQALRKAQRDRTPDRGPSDEATGQTATKTPPSGGMRPSLVRSLIIACGVLVILVVGLLFILLKDDSSPTVSNNTTAKPIPKLPVTAQAPSPTADLVDPVITAAKTASVNTPPVHAIESNVPTVVDELRKAREATEAALAAKDTDTPEALKPEPNKAIIDWLSGVKISGVLLSDSVNKVVLNGKTYASGEYVEANLGLRVMIIQEKRILFIDENGQKYMKRL